MDVLDTIESPWHNPVDYFNLVFWVVIFAIVAFALFDGLRIIAQWAKDAAN